MTLLKDGTVAPSRDDEHGILRKVTRGMVIIAVIAPIFVGTSVYPAYKRRSELQNRVYRGQISLLFSPFVYPSTYFHSRAVMPNWMTSLIGEDRVRPLEPLTCARLVPHCDDDVQKLTPEVELNRVIIIAEDSTCTDKLLLHLEPLPKLRSLMVCNVPITEHAAATLLRMQQLKYLCVECSDEPSPGLNRLSELGQLEEFSLMDLRCPVSDDVYRQISAMPRLRHLKLVAPLLTIERYQILAQSSSIESISIGYSSGKLTLEQARILAAMKSIKSIDVDRAKIEPDAEALLRELDLLVEEEVLLGLPPT